MPKIPMCTAEEANQIRTDLQGALAVVDGKIQPTVEAAATQLRREAAQLEEKVGKNAQTAEQASNRVEKDSMAFTDSRVQGLKKEMLPMFDVVEKKIAETNTYLESSLAKKDKALRVAFAEELNEVVLHLEGKIEAVKEELQAQAEKWALGAAEEIVKNRKEVDASIEELRKEARAQTEQAAQKSAQDLQKAKSDLEKALENAEDRGKRAESEIYLKIERLNDELQELQQSAKEQTDTVRSGALSQIKSLREDSEARLDHLDQEATKLRDAVAEVENVSTRRVDWVIQKVSQRLRPNSPSKASLHTSWFSPKFNMAGAHGLQLEIQLYRPSDTPVDGEAAGDCAVFLWACKGMSLVYKLYVGKKVQTMEKVFNGRVPYGSKRMCFLRDQINREDDTLRVSVEILEAVREVEHPIKPPAPPQDIDEAELATKALEGIVVFRRHVNNRVVDQVKKEVEIMRSRMVRRIEWRVEQAALLRRCFPPGESMCSAPFNAAGIENMQLIFYPSGYGNASDGFCSLYLFAPAGVTLKCALWAGNQRRDASHYFEEPGAFGRTNFCRFDSATDTEEDTVLIALEVEEAHQDVQANVAHPIVQPGDRRSESQINGDLPNKVDSVVKLKRVPGKGVSGMEDKRMLPSMWAAKSLSSDPTPDGFHTFDELRAKGGRPRGETSPIGSISAGRRSESMPFLRDGAPDKTRIDGGETVPLPQLTRSGGSDWALDSTTGSKGPRKGRVGSRRDRSSFGSPAAVVTH
mmetsp:Transcript_60100/g.135523  ORF Transcript_60100/g.135523 Transcript_60100/m.135523 type:complete len:750 (-) Transcript_60100:74-2323(-)|eukprot:CAMPEP_0197942506 /NCGR_PEP_ID=MMETSP1439-20131203/124441_1 /TAXON_ID=66791 /ORGANISM="Gonyaulax spinifera, Strain CCMP409" /LENGTH=749 /DNA_ID=CAMNT_0043565763 /DNA_START=91 /DNA_END=2340 /DNA_ORIENTATION=-